MKQRRLRPGDVLDDYCPRERRITDHAIVAMIDDTIQRTRCVVCDAEHEYKQAKVPAQRRKKAPALFTQVLDGLKAPARPPHVADSPDGYTSLIDSTPSEPASIVTLPVEDVTAYPVTTAEAAAMTEAVSQFESPAPPVVAETSSPPADDTVADRVDGPFRRRLIRAALPRPEGITPPARSVPEFTIRQPTGRPNRHGGRRRGQGQGHGQNTQTRFGRGGHGQRFNGNGRSGGHGGHGGPSGNRAGGSRRGKKR